MNDMNIKPEAGDASTSFILKGGKAAKILKGSNKRDSSHRNLDKILIRLSNKASSSVIDKRLCN